MWLIVLVIGIFAIIAGIVITDYAQYQDLQRRLKKEKEAKST